MEEFFKRKLSGKIQTIFWIIYLIFPLATGLLAYHWLPNESPILASGEVLKPFEILTYHEECEDSEVGDNCGTVADVWKNTETGIVYSKANFLNHRINERNRMAVTWFTYGLIGCFFFASVEHYKNKEFYKYFGIAMLINLSITMYIYLSQRINF